MNLLEFHSVCLINGIILDEEQIVLFERYHRELVYWNEKINLISQKDVENIYLRHFLHSLTLLKYIEIPSKSYCLDIGTGGGFPGIPLKIARQDLRFVLLESVNKKAKLAEMFAKHTGLPSVEVIAKRAENLGKDKSYINKFNFVFTRAVSRVKNILNWSIPFLKNGGKIIMLKGGNLQKEVDEAIKSYSNANFLEILIQIKNCDWFENEDKKILICSFTQEH